MSFTTIGTRGKGIDFKTSNVAWTDANELSKSPDIHFGHHCVPDGNLGPSKVMTNYFSGLRYLVGCGGVAVFSGLRWVVVGCSGLR